MSTSLPGFESPAVGFDQPFEMLEACHDRVRRSLTLLARLVDYLTEHPPDARSASAARDVLRYFELAAPLHHQDEELHVFPRLERAADPALGAAVARLRADHRRMEALWSELQPLLRRWSDDALPGEGGAVSAETVRPLAAEFAALYEQHLVVEESLAFPAARADIDDAALAAMSLDMAQRRTTSAER
ncbi:MAG TPA: hemerythrin domain-containing protein [Burkholderiaceae bacterium]|jgi:hemerythrin-like domain-containing protein|nr:hemerythrin domain-containing protein [Burkholderiaceae bacterium]